MADASCWICGDRADSREHIFKARDLKRLFDRGRKFADLPFHFRDAGHSRIPGPKSDKVKYQPSLCSQCNNARTARSDRAHDQLSDWFAISQTKGGVSQLPLDEVFGGNFRQEIEYLYRYFAKSLGCRVVATDVLLPDAFPNPITGAYLDRLRISICRTQPLRSLQNYEPEAGEHILGKGDLIATFSRSYFEQTGHRKITKAIWWETFGHFQINHWLNINEKPELGVVLDATSRSYNIVENDFDLNQMKDAMWDWLAR